MPENITPFDALIASRRFERFFNQMACLFEGFGLLVTKVELSEDETTIVTTIVTSTFE